MIIGIEGSRKERNEKWREVVDDFRNRGYTLVSYLKPSIVESIIYHKCPDCGEWLTPAGFKKFGENRVELDCKVYALCLNCRNFGESEQLPPIKFND